MHIYVQAPVQVSTSHRLKFLVVEIDPQAIAAHIQFDTFIEVIT